MKRKIQKAVLLITALFISLYVGIVSEAATSNDNKYYKLDNVKLSYDSMTGQVKATWNPPKKDTDKVVTLFLNNVAVAGPITVSGQTCDLTDEVIAAGVGNFRCEVYPVKLGNTYSVRSGNLKITEERLKKATSFDASNYTIEHAALSYDEKTSSILGSWTMTDKQSATRVLLMRGTTVVDTWQKAEGLSFDFTSMIAGKGAGTYLFKVYPTRIGDDGYMIESGELEVDADMVKKLKSKITAEQKKEEAQRLGWYHDGPTNIWKYYKEPGVLMKREWLDYNGHRYHFSSAGVMQIGWQVIDNKYYYFDSTGALVTNAVIGGSLKVNAAGERIDSEGNVLSAAGEKEAPAIPVTLTTCSVSVVESGKEVNVVKNATFKANAGYTIDSITFSVPYENWRAGIPVSVSLSVSATTNYSFGSGIKFSARGCKSVSSKGDSVQRVVTFNYYPKKQLAAPDYIYLNTETELCWKKVQDASKYKVVVTTDGTSVLTTISESTKVALSDYVNLDDSSSVTEIKIYAMAATGKTSYFTTSQATDIKNLYEFSLTNTIDGTITWNSRGMHYIDSTSEKMVGWKKLFSNWYYFNKNGYAVGPGWYLDKDSGLWYYFDSEYRMCTGKIYDGTGEYFLNDGSVTNLPLGAWVKP